MHGQSQEILEAEMDRDGCNELTFVEVPSRRKQVSFSQAVHKRHGAYLVCVNGISLKEIEKTIDYLICHIDCRLLSIPLSDFSSFLVTFS